jgi:hypothetical protein
MFIILNYDKNELIAHNKMKRKKFLFAYWPIYITLYQILYNNDTTKLK